MDHRALLSALADPTRQEILDRLRTGALPVGRIAERMTVTRPAVSQHLRVLLDAGVVTCTRQGTRSLYAIAPGGTRPLLHWLVELEPGHRKR